MTLDTASGSSAASDSIVNAVCALLAALRANPSILEAMQRPASVRLAMRKLADALYNTFKDSTP